MLARRGVLSLAFILALSGCAHPILLSPDAGALVPNGTEPIKKNVGLYVSAQDKAKEFVTPGGGGDKVSHYPYRDMEAGLYRVLSNVYADVTPMNSVNDVEIIRKKSISYVFVPTIEPTSSSESIFTWPPTMFTITLTCIAYDAEGKQISKLSVVGNGAAEFGEFKSNFSLSAHRASTDTLVKLQAELLRTPELQ